MTMLDDRDHGARSIAQDIRAAVGAATEYVSFDNLFSRLLIDHLGIVIRSPDGEGLLGINHYSVLYCPFADWSVAKTGDALGEWIFGEWSSKTVNKVLDTGEVISGTRVIVAQGHTVKSGNGTNVSLSRLAVGLIQATGSKSDGSPLYRGVHFVGAVSMAGLREVSGSIPERDFFSSITGFIQSRGDRIVPSFYPLKQGGSK